MRWKISSLKAVIGEASIEICVIIKRKSLTNDHRKSEIRKHKFSWLLIYIELALASNFTCYPVGQSSNNSGMVTIFLG